MCTLTYIPKLENGFLLTSNRDESVLREPALHPKEYLHNNIRVLYPKDPLGGGTWIATSDNGFTLCLLNGAFERHLHNPPYRHSRGLVVTDFFNYSNVETFVASYLLQGIEPFTLVIISCHETRTIHELRWDGANLHTKSVDANTPQIWSSSMLYDVEVIEQREKWFAAFLAGNPKPETADMLRFHHFGGEGKEATNILMNRNNILRTISITSVCVSQSVSQVLYEDVMAHRSSCATIGY